MSGTDKGVLAAGGLIIAFGVYVLFLRTNAAQTQTVPAPQDILLSRMGTTHGVNVAANNQAFLTNNYGAFYETLGLHSRNHEEFLN